MQTRKKNKNGKKKRELSPWIGPTGRKAALHMAAGEGTGITGIMAPSWLTTGSAWQGTHLPHHILVSLAPITALGIQWALSICLQAKQMHLENKVQNPLSNLIRSFFFLFNIFFES